MYIYIYIHTCKTHICPFLYMSLLFCVPLTIISVVLPSWLQTEKKNLFVVVLLLWLSLVCDKAQDTLTAAPYPPHPSHQSRSQPLQSVEKDPTPFFPSFPFHWPPPLPITTQGRAQEWGSADVRVTWILVWSCESCWAAEQCWPAAAETAVDCLS